MNFHDIIVIAYPVLLFIYPITIMLIILNVLSESIATPLVFRAVVIVTFMFSLPDVIGFISPSEDLEKITNHIPLAQHSLGWVLPALLALTITAFVQSKRKTE